MITVIDEKIELVAHDPAWREAASQEIAALKGLLRPYDAAVEHVGSTAVEGLAAKPILDVMIGLERPSDTDKVAEVLERAGWTDLGEAGVPGRRYLRRRDGRATNAHIVPEGSKHWRAALALRDYLRTHPEDRAAYGAAKARAMAAGGPFLLAYSDQKAPYMQGIVARALAWAAAG